MRQGTVQLVRLALICAFVGGTFRVGAQTPGAQTPGGQQPATPSRNAVTTGEFVVEPPTLINLGFEVPGYSHWASVSNGLIVRCGNR